MLGREKEYLLEVLESGRWASGGKFTERCADSLRQATGSRHVYLTPSGTSALEAASLVAGIRPGDEVILPSWTFPSTANAFLLRGAVPVFVDIRPDTFNLDESLIDAAVTERTRAIVVVHYAGVCCEMDAINAIAARHGLTVIEDAAHAYLSTYKGRPAGTLGSLACFSFHETKNISCGEGGALLVADDRASEIAEVVVQNGTNRARFLRGEIECYSWIEPGSSYLISEFQAAVLASQLEKAPEITAERIDLWKLYDSTLAAWGESELQRPHVPAHCGINAHIYPVLAASESDRNRLIARLREKGIAAATHFTPLHESDAGRKFGRQGSRLQVTSDVARRLLRLPLKPGPALSNWGSGR